MKCQFNLLEDEMLGVVCKDDVKRRLNLPAVLELLGHDAITSFSGLRPHQWQSWHCFLVQCAVLALLKRDEIELPENEASWRKALRGLTPEFADDEPWSLVVADPEKPAFMQVPVPHGSGAAYKSVVSTPDSLDMLVTSKNHDVKQHCAQRPAIDDWVYSLISLQTMEGFLGAGNYGASRMNGGFSNRCFMGLAPKGGIGAHVMRDIRMLLHIYQELAENYQPTYGKTPNVGTGLVWLVPWDGTGPLTMHTLHPLYIEVCRRVRFSVDEGETLLVKTAGSKKERIDAKVLDGNTGDPWAPLVSDKKGLKSITITGAGFDYRMACRLLFNPEDGYQASPLSKSSQAEADTEIVFSAVVRGQGKTEGLRQRRIPVTPPVRRLMARQRDKTLGDMAARRLKTISEIQKHLRQCITLQNAGAPSLENGRLDFKAPGDGDRERAMIFSEAFDQYIDAVFFDDLWQLAALQGEEAQAIEKQWRHKITRKAETILDQAASAMPKRGHLHRGTRAKVKSYFIAVARKEEWLITQNTADEVAL